MRNKISGIFLAIIALLLLTDIYVYFKLSDEYSNLNENFSWIYHSITFIFLVYMGFVMVNRYWESKRPVHQRKIYNLMGFLILIFFPKIIAGIFFLVNDLISIFISLITNNSEFILFFQAGLILGIASFFLIAYGIVFGKYHFKIEKLSLSFANFPSGKNGLKIIHISDIHIGSWAGDYKQFRKAVDLINSRNADLILFTGDLVNNFVEEIEGFEPIFTEMQARIGKYSILGNHDYGDYFNWSTAKEKQENLKKLIEAHKDLGFQLLLNDSITITDDHSSIGILGVENWGLPPFHQNGNLKEAIQSLGATTDFNILLSHDPSHWKAEVIKREEVDLMLAGHTHGMQFGVYTKKYKWSPAKWKYPEWGGVYRSDGQTMYVNTGLGHIGFPGRIGIRPKITEIKLYRK